MAEATIPGYTYGQANVPGTPLAMEEFALLQQTVLWTNEDARYIQMAGTVLDTQVEEVLDVWYGFVASHPHLVYYFQGADGAPSQDYLARVRQRFGQWIRDTCQRPYDQDWLNYHHEIGLRHHRSKKNQTDGVQSVPIIPLRYMIAFIVPITVTIKPFLAKQGHTAEEVEKMYQAWFKSLVLQVTLWSYPYAREGDF